MEIREDSLLHEKTITMQITNFQEIKMKPDVLRTRHKFIIEWDKLPRLVSYILTSLFSYGVPILILYIMQRDFTGVDAYLGLGGGALVQSGIIAMLRDWKEELIDKL
jgi:hypothetical protein